MIVRGTLRFLTKDADDQDQCVEVGVDIEVAGYDAPMKVLQFANPDDAVPHNNSLGPPTDTRKPELAFVPYDDLRDEVLNRVDFGAIVGVQERSATNARFRFSRKGDIFKVLGCLSRYESALNDLLDKMEAEDDGHA